MLPSLTLTIGSARQVFGSIERNFKNTNVTIGKMNSDVRDLKDNLNSVQKLSESKLKEEANHIYKNVDFKLEKNKRDIQNLLAEFKNNIAITMKKQEENIQLKTDVSVEDQEDSKHYNYDQQIQNIYRELGMLRCEMEIIYDRERRKSLHQNFQRIESKVPEHLKSKTINKLEQAVFLEELEKFDLDNQERLLFEFNQLEEKIEQLKDEKGSEIVRSELNHMEDKLFNLKHQIHGTKKKYLIDATRIEGRMERLKGVISDPHELQEFQDRIDSINASIVRNVETLKLRQNDIDERLVQLKN